ncbi:MAG: N-acetyl-gamma-glutamyl-phosphate reductase [Planctomycetota bacterium]|nr:MAG: N-acetyl-gamma-glutamyl-phosphate reductase [Planctomycetota bacterium]
MQKKIKAGIIGATGLAGEGVLDILIKHPNVEVTVLTSDSSTGKNITDVFPKYKDIIDIPLVAIDLDTISNQCELIFLTKKDPASMNLVKPLIDNNVKVIDLGGEFRLKDFKEYESWYGHEHLAKDLLSQASYGLSELNREEIKTAKLIANPGCYPTGSILGLTPLIKNNLIDLNTITIISYSGISGAGRAPSNGNTFINCNENIKAYAVGGSHKHTPEIEQGLSMYSGQEVKVSFTPHLAPMERGIFSSISSNAINGVTQEKLVEALKSAYENEHYVRVFDDPSQIQISNVKNTNFCDLGVALDSRTNRVLLFTALDNLTKGAASQAIQNMNLMFGFDESTAI